MAQTLFLKDIKTQVSGYRNVDITTGSSMTTAEVTFTDNQVVTCSIYQST